MLARDFVELFPDVAIQIFNHAAKFGIPDHWRTARVIPLHKKGSKNEVKNFRPISNLNSLRKTPARKA
jgi:hypothetical protein